MDSTSLRSVDNRHFKSASQKLNSVKTLTWVARQHHDYTILYQPELKKYFRLKIDFPLNRFSSTTKQLIAQKGDHFVKGIFLCKERLRKRGIIL